MISKIQNLFATCHAEKLQNACAGFFVGNKTDLNNSKKKKTKKEKEESFHQPDDSLENKEEWNKSSALCGCLCVYASNSLFYKVRG